MSKPPRDRLHNFSRRASRHHRSMQQPQPLPAKLGPTPLPPNPFDTNTQPELYRAYSSCTRLESDVIWERFVDEPAKDSEEPEAIMLKTSPQVAGRTLGYALIKAPSEASRDCIAREINDCNDDPEVLAGLAHLYIFGLIRIFQNPKGPTPAISPDLSPRLSFRAAPEDHAETMKEAKNTPGWLKEQVLGREAYRCAFTRKLDRGAAQSDTPTTEKRARLQVAHIISQSLERGVGLQWASTATAVLDRFGGMEIRKLLNNLDIHLPIKAIACSYDAHALFDELGLWLIPAVDEHGDVIEDTYRINLHDPSNFPTMDIVREVHFRRYTTPEGVVVRPPSPALLALQAACASIAHMSGAAEVLDDFFGDGSPPHGHSLSLQDMSVNAGGAAELIRALNRVVIVGAV